MITRQRKVPGEARVLMSDHMVPSVSEWSI